MALVAPASAQEGSNAAGERDFAPRFEITPFVGYRVGGKFDYDGIAATQTLDVRDDSILGRRCRLVSRSRVLL